MLSAGSILSIACCPLPIAFFSMKYRSAIDQDCLSGHERAQVR